MCGFSRGSQAGGLPQESSGQRRLSASPQGIRGCVLTTGYRWALERKPPGALCWTIQEAFISSNKALSQVKLLAPEVLQPSTGSLLQRGSPGPQNAADVGGGLAPPQRRWSSPCTIPATVQMI